MIQKLRLVQVIYITGLLSLLVGGLSCSSLPKDWFQSQTFVAADASYFPPFIHKFFPTARNFEQQYPRLKDAARDLTLISIRPLIQTKHHSSEANLSWSKNGQYLSYERQKGRKNSIEIRELSGRYYQRLSMQNANKQRNHWLSIPHQSFNSGLSWSNDEKQFAFVSNGGRGKFQIYIGDIDSTPEPIPSGSGRQGFASWNPNQSEIAYISSQTGGGDLYTYSLDRKTHERVWSHSSTELFPEWLPQGNGIVFNSGPSNRHQIMVSIRDITGKWRRPHAITQWPNDNLRPKLSPNGQWVAFFGSRTHNNWDLYVLPVSSRSASSFDMHRYRVARNVVLDLNTGPSWSPDSSHIFFVKDDPQNFNPIFAYDLRKGRTFQIPTNTRMNRDLMISRYGVLSFRAQVGAWDKVFVALTNLGEPLSSHRPPLRYVSYLDPSKPELLAKLFRKERL